MTDKLEEEINLYDKIIVKNYNDLSLAEQFKKGAVVKVDDELTILKQQLAIAVEALKNYTQTGYNVAQRALNEIEELEK